MNYLQLNGRDSREITGLLIESLPVQSKPLMRTEIEEIDGRDGDIVRKLGYSAYDKEVRIGLYGNFDIDEIISFFDSEGTVVFSNEITKYYRYQVIEQIDFERLLRFREATVTMHCQPFKYSTIEEKKTLIDGENLLTQEIVSFSDIGGIDLDYDGETNTVYGTSTGSEIYVPINPITVANGDYSMNIHIVNGDQCSGAFFRLIEDSPTKSLGDTYAEAKEIGTTVSVSGTVQGTHTFNYIYLYVQKGVLVSFEFTAEFRSGNNSALIRNSGNVFSKPILTVYGDGEAEILLNGEKIFDLNIDGYVTIDTEAMEAYKGTALANRRVLGDYDRFRLNVGRNTIGWTGSISQIEMENYSRWL